MITFFCCMFGCACVPRLVPYIHTHTRAVNGPETISQGYCACPSSRIVYKPFGGRFCKRDSIKIKQTIILEFICRANCQSRFGATRPHARTGWPFVSSRPINCSRGLYISFLSWRSPFFLFLRLLLLLLSTLLLIYCHPCRNCLF